MPTVRMKATKMTDAKVSYISLVTRGANRMPFKIIKSQEKPMSKSPFSGIDLASMFHARKNEGGVEQASVVGFVTMKDENFDAVKEQLSAQGIDVSNPEEMSDGSVVFKQGDEELEEGAEVIRVNDHVAMVTKGFKPYAMEMNVGEKSFEDTCKAQGFYPGMATTIDVLRSSVLELTSKADDPKSAAEEVAALFEEAKEYVTSMVKGLPQVAFKAEAIEVQPVAKTDESATEDEGEGDEAATDDKGSSEEEGKKVVAKSEDKKGDDEKPVTLTSDDVSTIVTNRLNEMATSLVQKLGDQIKAQMAEVQKSVSGIETKVAEATKVAKEAKDKVSGLVVHGASSDDQDDKPIVRKEEAGVHGGREIDTAFMGLRPGRAR